MPDSPAVMHGASLITFDAPLSLAAGAAVVVASSVVWFARRASGWPIVAHVLLVLGLIALALAAGQPSVARSGPRRVAVLVDVSPSTRGATYRNGSELRARIARLISGEPYEITYFADGNLPAPSSPDAQVAADLTRWSPPADASAVLLFSDGNFQPPATSPPVYAVIDAALERPLDARVVSLEERSSSVAVAVENRGTRRSLGMSIGDTTENHDVEPGMWTIAARPVSPGTRVVAKLTPGDAWPENDVASLVTAPLPEGEKWWVGASAVPTGGGWRAMQPADLPVDPLAYLAPSIIVLNNVPADAMSDAQGQRIHQYLRDLGGGLLIVGGDHAFAAGGYDGSALDATSPLASSPPTPAAHWIVLIDSSGSMASPYGAGAQTRHAAAVAAAKTAIGRLPPADPLSIGGFAEQLRWWSRGAAVKDFALPEVPPPHGPTNLDAALRAVAASLDKGAANQIILMTDGQVELPDVPGLSAAIKSSNARMHIFTIGSGPGVGALQKLSESTGGRFAQESDVAQWMTGLVDLLRQVAPRHWMTEPARVSFDERVIALPEITTASWNRTWLKSGAEAIARVVDPGNQTVPMAARMNVGNGKSVAVAFGAADDVIERLAALAGRRPRDSRLSVSWRITNGLAVTVVAIDGGKPLNGLTPALALSSSTNVGARPVAQPIPQTGPGRYELRLPAPREPQFAVVTESGRVVDERAIAGHYAQEFERIGNDRDALRSLAERTGGRVIEPAETEPIALPPRRDRVPVTSYVSAAGALLVALGLVAWRVNR